MAEEEFHEIQLNGKQLVFLFMAGTVAAVVIFLSGLMVGRNLRAPRLEAAAAATEQAANDPTRDAELPLPSASTPDGGPPPSTKEKLTYAGQLEAPTPVDEPLRDEPRTPVDPTVEKPVPAVAKAAPAAVKPPAIEKPLAFAEPTGNGWAVQVQAVNSRGEAESIARRLNAKGYPAFVTPRKTGYGIRVGKYPKKQEAEAMKAVLERKEQFKPWVTR
jgi:cell division septation protein DedD